MVDQKRLADCLNYLEQHRPSKEVLERFGQSIEDWEIKYPLYDEASDTLSGVVRLLFTLAIAHDLGESTMDGFAERYCYEDPVLGLEELISWHQRQFNDQRPAGWVASRMVSGRAIRESFEKYHSDTYGYELLPYMNKANPDHVDVLSNKEVIAKDLGCDVNTVQHLFAYLVLTRQAD